MVKQVTVITSSHIYATEATTSNTINTENDLKSGRTHLLHYGKKEDHIEKGKEAGHDQLGSKFFPIPTHK